MPRILNITVEVTDAEYAAFLERLGTRGTVAGGPVIAADVEGDTSGDKVADASTLDANGVPWIESVHASTKGLTKENFWRGKKGVTADQRKAVEDAWKASNNASFTVPGSITGDGTGGPVTIPAGPVSLPGLPGAAPVGLPGLPAAAAPAPVSYEDLVAKYTTLATAGKITPDAMGAIYGKHGVTDMQVLMSNEALRTAIVADLNQIG